MLSQFLIYFVVSFINVFLHIVRSIMVIKSSSKAKASAWNALCYTFSAVVIKFIAEVDLWVAIAVQSITNYIGCYVGMWYAEKKGEKQEDKGM